MHSSLHQVGLPPTLQHSSNQKSPCGNARQNVTLLRLSQLEPTIGIKKSKIYAMIAAGKFPAPVRLGPKSVAWRSDEVQAWIEGLPRTRSKGGAL